MNFYELDKKKYKELSKEFRKTYVGKHLYSIFKEFYSLSIIFCFSKVVNILFTSETNVLLEFANVTVEILIIITVITYYSYFKNLKQYIESKK